MAEATTAMVPLILAALFSALPKRWRKGPIGAPEMARLIRSPKPHFGVDRSHDALVDAITAVVEARTELELVGSRAARAEASKLIAACVEFADTARQPLWPWQVRDTTARLHRHRAVVVRARDRYLASVQTPESLPARDRFATRKTGPPAPASGRQGKEGLKVPRRSEPVEPMATAEDVAAWMLESRKRSTFVPNSRGR